MNEIRVVLVDNHDLTRIELTQKLQQSQKDLTTGKTKVLILTMQTTEDSVLGAFAAGADSYSLKNVSTVKTHVRNILNKLCVDDRTQAAVRALRFGLVK